MFRIVIVSATGGTGRSSLAAGLARLLARDGPVVAVDFDPGNLLGVYLGTVHPPEQGLATNPDVASAQQLEPQLQLLPFGNCDRQQLRLFEQRLRGEADWLKHRLAGLELADPAMVLIDTARAPGIYAEQAVAAADLVLVVVNCSMPSLVGMDRPIGVGASGQTACVINKLNSTRPLQRDIHAVLRSRLGGCPQFCVHYDEAIPEAQASNRSLPDYAPHSQAVQDLQELAVWLLQKARQ